MSHEKPPESKAEKQEEEIALFVDLDVLHSK